MTRKKIKKTPREIAHSKRLFALLALLTREKVVEMTRVSKIFSGSHVFALDAIRKLKDTHKINIQIYTRRTGSTFVRYFILR